MSTPAISSETVRLRGIDALRGIAALGVVLYHTFDRSVVPDNLLRYPIGLLQLLSTFGYIGVFLFFVISGFCIHLQWARARANNQTTPIKFGSFWKRRLRRLYPPYLIALAIYLILTAWSIGIVVNHSFLYDVGMHLLMLHNLDPKTCYTVNGVFWTLAIEEQLYLAYFLLLFIRRRLGWGWTLLICLLARLGWMIFSHVVWLKSGIGVPVPESAAAHWFTWALGAISVEAYFGLIAIPRWARNLKIATVLLIAASAISYYLPGISKDTPWHSISWFLIHPMWGVGFFIVINRAVQAEARWLSEFRLPLFVSLFATVGVFSYSVYLTHEIIVMESWRFVHPFTTPLLNLVFVLLPAVLLFAWMFFWFCERPFMRKKVRAALSPARFKSDAATPAALEITSA